MTLAFVKKSSLRNLEFDLKTGEEKRKDLKPMISQFIFKVENSYAFNPLQISSPNQNDGFDKLDLQPGPNAGSKNDFPVSLCPKYDQDVPFNPNTEIFMQKYKRSKSERRAKIMEEMKTVYGNKRLGISEQIFPHHLGKLVKKI